MSFTRADGRTECRRWAVDTDTSNPGLDDAEWNAILNAVYTEYAPYFESSTLYEQAIALATPDYQPQLDLTGTNVNVREFRMASINAGGGVVFPLEQQPWQKVRSMAMIDSNLGKPRCFGPRMLLNVTGDNQLWIIYLWPRPSATYDGTLSVTYIPEHLAMGSDADEFSIPDQDAIRICRVAGAVGAMILDQPENVIQAALQGLPDRLNNEIARRYLDGRRPRTVEDVTLAKQATP